MFGVTRLITFCYGVAHLLVLRFQTGDVYAPYSTLRSDPLGTRVLFESLASMRAWIWEVKVCCYERFTHVDF